MQAVVSNLVRMLAGACSVLLIQGSSVAQSAPAQPTERSLYETGQETSLRLTTDSARWTARHQAGPGIESRARVVRSAENWRLDLSIASAAEAQDYLTILCKDGAWFATQQGRPIGKYRPFE